jgi:hypothetical protein
VKDADNRDIKHHDIDLITTDDDELYAIKYNGDDTYLHTEQVFVVSVKDL